jgi:5-methylcytosine-specific restriction endonuclease McrA
MFENGGHTIDELEQLLVDGVALVSSLTARMLPAIRALDVAQVASVDGARSMDEWLAGRLDLEVHTARTLLALARADDDRVSQSLTDGSSVDRTSATLRLIQSGADQSTIDASAGYDLAGVRQLTNQHRRITAQAESGGFADRFLHIQPSLDDTSWKLWGQLTGVDGRLVEKAIQTAVDSLPNNPDTTSSQDRADGLVSVASEWLSGEVGGHELTAEVFVDADLAAVSAGERGVSVVTGPRVGPGTLGEILCAGNTRVTVSDEITRTVSTSPSSRSIPAAIRAYVLQRDGHRCVVAGCRSRTRLQPHHLIPFSKGGTHHPDNLATVCWYHHVVIHMQGLEFDPDSPPQRRTFLRATPARAGP